MLEFDRVVGHVEKWHEDRGFGTIWRECNLRRNDPARRAWFHRSWVHGPPVKVGDRVSCRLRLDEAGRLQGYDVEAYEPATCGDEP